ncbi:hypothetical protein V6N13_012936 [Hibiscus sabdariffa]|uniref:Uncharacterized protein n=1 Tax=Hibiscus sabdariffa TaxID=183260 RepID=A0ABR2SGH7_9ROSI
MEFLNEVGCEVGGRCRFEDRTHELNESTALSGPKKRGNTIHGAHKSAGPLDVPSLNTLFQMIRLESIRLLLCRPEYEAEATLEVATTLGFSFIASKDEVLHQLPSIEEENQ